MLRELADQWHTQFGCTPLLAETFADPQTFYGTCYKASNWTAAGTTAGYSRYPADFYEANQSPKRLCLSERSIVARPMALG